MKNPFFGYGTVVLGERLVGRNDDIRRLSDYLMSHAGSIGIIGEHRIGKSALISEVWERLGTEAASACFAKIDLSVPPDSTQVFIEILDGLVENLEERSIDLPAKMRDVLKSDPVDSYSAFRQLQKGLMVLRRAGYNSLVMLDEFDAVRLFQDAASFIQRLRSLIDSRYQTGFVAAIISRRSLIAIEKQLPGVSNIDGVCHKHYLGPLDETGLDAMVGRCGDVWKLSLEDRQELSYYTGGHPYLAEMILCRGWDERSVGKGAAASLSDILDHYRRLYELLDEDEMFDQLLQLAVGPAWNLKLEAVERLLRYGIVRRDLVERGYRYRGWSEHFQAWLEKYARERPLTEVWRETECTVRDMIEEICYREMGDGWIDVLASRHQSVGVIIKGCRERMEKEAQRFGPTGSERLLEFTYPDHLWQIIAAEWKHFSPLLGKEKRYWGERFALMSKIRTPSAHNREYVVPAHELTAMQASCQELLAVLREPDR